MRLAALFLFILGLAAAPLAAQDAATDDKTFLETWLETNLSTAGRDVVVQGFAGALSSQATLEELTIADEDGVWFTMRGAQLDWTRSALLTGRLEVDTLTAREIEITRRPLVPGNGPRAEASDFALPDLPVSIEIGRITAERVVLGAEVLGQDAVLRLDGRGRLEGGEGEARAILERIDGRRGTLRMDGSYANETRALAIDLELSEGPGGIAASLVGLPGEGAVDLSVAGAGPIDAFDARIRLATDGADRLAGTVTLRGLGSAGDPAQGLVFHADLKGDPSALLQPDYRAFFGADTSLALDGKRLANGLTEVSSLAIQTGAMSLGGEAILRPGGWPEKLRLTGRIANPDGSPVRLPLATPTRADGAELTFDFDARRGEDWTGALTLTGLSRPDLALARLELSGTGALFAGGADRPARILGTVDVSAAGLAPADPALAEALGGEFDGVVSFAKQSGSPLALSRIRMEGAGFAVTGALALDTEIARLDVLASGELTLDIASLSRLSAMAGQPLAGAAMLGISGNAALPGGPFDIEIRGTGEDLATGFAQVDALFAGTSRLAIDAVRDASGTRIERFEVQSERASAEAQALLRSGASSGDLRLSIPSGAALVEGFDGPAALIASGQQAGRTWTIDLDATAPGATQATGDAVIRTGATGIEEISARIEGKVGDLSVYSGFADRKLGGAISLETKADYAPASGDFHADGTGTGSGLAFGLPVLDRLIGGDTQLAYALGREDGVLRLDGLDLTSPELTLTAASAGADEARRVQVTATLRDLGRVAPGLSGPAEASGDGEFRDGRWHITAHGTGPGGTRLDAAGSLGPDGLDPALDLSGQAPLAFANDVIAPRQVSGTAGFNLRLSGDYRPANLSGQVTTSDARLAVPTLRMAFGPIVASARLGGGQAIIDVDAPASSGGRVSASGPVDLAAPFASNLDIRLAALGLTDPTLFDTTASGAVSVTGPLTGGGMIAGRITLGAAELRVPETGFGASGELPGLQHVGETSAIRRTRERAGLVSNGNAGGATPFGLDLAIDAPSQIFLRGRGLDAEFGGGLQIGGTTADVVARGGFQLIRGRLDLLGKRLVISEGSVTLRGRLDPYLRAVAETRAGEVQVRILLEGPASDPSVTFSSSPDLPEDEILARLVFGRGIDRISPFQALKLASAVATLAGKGGAGTVGKLRSTFGLDDLDVTTDPEGNTSVRAGTYITDNIYTDVTVSPSGEAEINLNLTITPNLTARGRVSGSGDTGIGIYYERDY